MKKERENTSSAEEKDLKAGAANEAAKPEETAGGPENKDTPGNGAPEADEGAGAKSEQGAGPEADATQGKEKPGETQDAPDQEGADETDVKPEKLSRKEKKAVAKLEEELAAVKDRYVRVLAEYENFRKRTEKEKADIYAYAVRDVCLKLLPVLDNLERGLAAVTEETKDDPFAAGMDQICKQFVKALGEIGVEPMDAAGKPFDPNRHNAVLHVDDKELGENVVAEELQKGYIYKDGVVRHAMVKVAN